MLEFKDKSGKLVKIGDFIIYGHALGRCAGLQYAKVMNIIESKTEDYYTKKKTIKLRVQGVDSDWTHREPELLSKKSTLSFPERILIVSEEQVDPKVLFILKN